MNTSTDRVVVTCEYQHFPIVKQWLKLWQELGRPLPLSISVRGDVDDLLSLEATRNGYSTSASIDLRLINSTFKKENIIGSTMCAIIYALDSRKGHPTLAAVGVR